jgi:hypothetical protein
MSIDIASRNRMPSLFEITENIGNASIKKADTIMIDSLVVLTHHGVKGKPGKCREIVPGKYAVGKKALLPDQLT